MIIHRPGVKADVQDGDTLLISTGTNALGVPVTQTMLVSSSI
jgi:hypothetical protein